MREIKFRAWNDVEMIPSDNFWLGADGHAALFGDDGHPYYVDWKLMQYTGLKDKNGVGIFEGDLVLVKEVRICEVIFHEKAGCWDLLLRNAISSDSIGAVCPASYQYHTEVIGNIYQDSYLLNENPELLEK